MTSPFASTTTPVGQCSGGSSAINTAICEPFAASWTTRSLPQSAMKMEPSGVTNKSAG